MPQSPQRSAFRRLYEDYSKPGGALNTLKAGAAGLLGAPSDILQMAASVAQPPAVRAVHGSPQIPGNSDQLAGLLGADLERPSGLVGLMGAPDPTDFGRVGGLLGMTLFHGTPHKFDMFELSPRTIGTGEGAQAYGHGLYFAESPGVASGYQSTLSGAGTIRGIPVEDIVRNPSYDEKTKDLANEMIAAHRRGGTTGGTAEKKKVLEDLIKNRRQDLSDLWEDASFGGGHLYEVDIPDETIDKMLDWDAPLGDQGGEVLSALERDPSIAVALMDAETGGEAYDVLEQMLGSQEAASKYLSEAGIPGIRFFDGQNRMMPFSVQPMYKGKPYGEPIHAVRNQVEELTKEYKSKGFDVEVKEGTRNIVVFNPDDIKQVKRDGTLVYKAK